MLLNHSPMMLLFRFLIDINPEDAEERGGKSGGNRPPSLCVCTSALKMWKEDLVMFQTAISVCAVWCSTVRTLALVLAQMRNGKGDASTLVLHVRVLSVFV